MQNLYCSLLITKTHFMYETITLLESSPNFYIDAKKAINAGFTLKIKLADIWVYHKP